MWTTAFYMLCVEIFLIGLCCIPSARWREIVVKMVTSKAFKTVSSVRHGCVVRHTTLSLNAAAASMTCLISIEWRTHVSNLRFRRLALGLLVLAFCFCSKACGATRQPETMVRPAFENIFHLGHSQRYVTNHHDAGQRLQEKSVMGHTGQFEAHMYRAQRNTYIAGSLLFCMGVLREFYWSVRERRVILYLSCWHVACLHVSNMLDSCSPFLHY